MKSVTFSKQKQRSLVIIGNGMATGRLLDEILKRSPNKYQITVIGKEPHGSYNRIMLSSVLAGEVTIEGIIQKPATWYQDNNITFLSDTLVTSIDSKAKSLTLSEKKEAGATHYSYDELIIAVGSRSAKIPAKNQDVDGIFNFRDIDDTQKIQAFAQADNPTEKQAVVIGGGLLGLEAAYGLAISGVKVTLVHRNKWLLNRQLDEVSGKMLEKIMSAKNISFALGNEVATFESSHDGDKEYLTGATLTNGDYIPATMAVIATGITPNKEIATSANINVERAIVVDDYMQTSNEFISALGECCQHKSATFGLVDPIWQQCITLAERLTNDHFKAFKNSPVPTKLKVSGVQLFSAGQVESCDDSITYTLKDKKAAIYRKIIIKNDCIVGVVLFGDVSSGMHYFDLMQNSKVITQDMPELLIGEEYTEQDNSLSEKAA